jgi:hypothetical protein
MATTRAPRIVPLTLLAAASGARTFSGLAGVARARADEPRPRAVHWVDRKVANAALGLAAFEMMADKAPGIPDRVSPASLFGRVLAGAAIGAALADGDPRGRKRLAVAGALIAFTSAHLTFRLRRALADEIPGFAAGLIEDAVVAGVAAAGTALLRDLPDHVRPQVL